MGVERRTDDVTRARVESALETAALEAARAAARKTAFRASGGYFLLVLVLLVGAVSYQSAVNRRLDGDALVQCQRVQKQRERTNVSDARQYLILINAVSNPRTPPRIRERYTEIANTATYDPPTDCPAAVARPRSYVRPPSRPFSRLGLGYAERLVMAARAGLPQPPP